MAINDFCIELENYNEYLRQKTEYNNKKREKENALHEIYLLKEVEKKRKLDEKVKLMKKEVPQLLNEARLVMFSNKRIFYSMDTDWLKNMIEVLFESYEIQFYSTAVRAPDESFILDIGKLKINFRILSSGTLAVQIC